MQCPEDSDETAHKLPYDGDLTELNEYLNSIGIKPKDGLILVTRKQHMKIHKIESRRFNNEVN